jgi:hypothetical protein
MCEPVKAQRVSVSLALPELTGAVYPLGGAAVVVGAAVWVGEHSGWLQVIGSAAGALVLTSVALCVPAWFLGRRLSRRSMARSRGRYEAHYQQAAAEHARPEPVATVRAWVSDLDVWPSDAEQRRIDAEHQAQIEAEPVPVLDAPLHRVLTAGERAAERAHRRSA